MSSIGLRIVTDLRNKLYEQIQKQSLSFFTEHPTGLLMSRITNDVQSIQTASSEAITSIDQRHLYADFFGRCYFLY